MAALSPPTTLPPPPTTVKEEPPAVPTKKAEPEPDVKKEPEQPPAKVARTFPPLTLEVVGHMMQDLNKSKDYSHVAEQFLGYSPEARAEGLSLWIKRCLRTARCEDDRLHLPKLLDTVARHTFEQQLESFKVAAEAAKDKPPAPKSYAAASGSVSGVAPTIQSVVAELQMVVLSVVSKEIIKAKAWDEAPKVWKFWAQAVGAGSITQADGLSEEVLMGENIAVAGVTAEKPVISAAKAGGKNAPPPLQFQDTKVLHQGLHNEVLKKLLAALKTAFLKAPDVRLFITSVLNFNNTLGAAAPKPGVAPAPWYYLDHEADFARFRPLAVCARADDDSNDARRQLVDSFFSDDKLKNDDVEHMIYWWCRKDRVGADATGKLNAIFEAIRKHPQTRVSATMVAKIVGAVRASGAICGDDFFESFFRVIHIAVDGPDRALRELYVLTELYHTGRILDFLISSAAGFGNTKALRKAGVVSEETMTRAKKLLGLRGDAHTLVGFGSK